MANPNPQHNPTDGLGVAAYVQVSGTGITNCSGGSGTAQGTNGQGKGATPSGTSPVAQYALSMNVGGTPNAATCQLTATAVDAKNNAYSTVGSFIYKSYNNPSAGSPAWYNPKNFGTYNANVASVSSSGLITAVAPGQAIIEVQFPVFDNTLGTFSQTGNPQEMIYAQIVVTVGA